MGFAPYVGPYPPFGAGTVAFCLARLPGHLYLCPLLIRPAEYSMNRDFSNGTEVLLVCVWLACAS